MAAVPKRTAGDDCPLPHEMWTEILTRLPVKSILRCRSVCKSWYSLISCPNFVSDYSMRNLNKNGNRLLLQPYEKRGRRAFPFSSHDESFMESREHGEVPEAFLGSDLKIVGSCNGLICLSNHGWYDGIKVIRFLIWNPTIRKVVEVPAVNTMKKPYCGFGFDFKTGDYKIMCMHSSLFDRKKRDCSDAARAVFDLSEGVWRSISPPVNSWSVCPGPPECYLNGAVHWSGYIHAGSSDMILLSFNMSDEIFREIRMPDYAKFVWNGDDDDYEIETRSVTCGGLIHVIVWKYFGNHSEEMKCSVLAMKEYGVAESWTILFNLDLVCVAFYLFNDPNNFRLWENGQVLMLHDLPVYDDDYDWDEYREFGDRLRVENVNNLSHLLRALEICAFTKRV